MRPIFLLIRACVPLSRAAEQAVVATAADWLYESRNATSRAQRLLVNVKSTWAMGRALVEGEWRGASFGVEALLGRLLVTIALVTTLLVFTPLAYIPKVDAPLFAFLLFRLTQAIPLVVMALPVIVFLVEVTGRRTRRGPTLGILFGLAAVVLIGLVLLAEARFAVGWLDWRFFGRFFGFPSHTHYSEWPFSHLRWLKSPYPIVMILVTWCAAVLARRIRERGGVRGWGLMVLPMVMSLALAVPMAALGSARSLSAALPVAVPFGVFVTFVVWGVFAVLARRRSRRPVDPSSSGM